MNRKDWESVWLDFLEKETEPSLQSDLKVLLSKSQEHKNTFRSLSITRDTLKLSSQEEPKWSEEEMDVMARNVMASIQEVTPTPKFWARVAKNRVSISTSIAALLILILGVVISQKDLGLVGGERVAQKSDWIIQLSAEHPEVFSNTLINDRSGDEIILEAAAEQFDQMSELEIEQLFSSF